MSAVLETTEIDAIELAAECLYRFLGAALRDPASRGWRLLDSAANRHLACEAARLLRDEATADSSSLGAGELPPEALDIEALAAELEKPAEALQAEYDRVFGLVQPRECPPYETEYHSAADAFLRSQQMADVA